VHLRVEFSVDVEDTGHVIVAVGLTLHLFVIQEITELLLVLAIETLELLSAGTHEEGDHDLWGRLREEGQLGVGAGGVLLNLLP
jgi:hypothetical protein